MGKQFWFYRKADLPSAQGLFYCTESDFIKNGYSYTEYDKTEMQRPGEEYTFDGTAWAINTIKQDDMLKEKIKEHCKNECSLINEVYRRGCNEDLMVQKGYILENQRKYTSVQFQELLTYINDLYNFVDNPDSLTNPTYPTRPAWIII
jgi:hypothetical protein